MPQKRTGVQVIVSDVVMKTKTREVDSQVFSKIDVEITGKEICKLGHGGDELKNIPVARGKGWHSQRYDAEQYVASQSR